MTPEIVLGFLAAVLGGVLVAITNQLLTRRKTNAEALKLEAEAGHLLATTEKLRFEHDLLRVMPDADHDPPHGWLVAGSDPQNYRIGIDRSVCFSGTASAHIESLIPTDGFVTLMQSAHGDTFEGKRVKMSGYVKTERVTGWVGLWLRADRHTESRSVAFDNMSDRPIKGSSDWAQYDIVLDIPDGTSKVAFGVILGGSGECWVDHLVFQLVSEQVPVTVRQDSGATHPEPVNLEFEQENGPG